MPTDRDLHHTVVAHVWNIANAVEFVVKTKTNHRFPQPLN